jgi:hypothetical protein
MKEPINFDKLPKDRRDWLEIFGNQWGSRKFPKADTALTDEERQALTDALNPFRK